MADTALSAVHRAVDWWGVVFTGTWMDRGGGLRAFDVYMRDEELSPEAEEARALAAIRDWLDKAERAHGPLTPVPWACGRIGGL